jgi:hypothetical protein
MSNAHTWTRRKAQGSHWSNLICEGSEIVATVNGTGYPTGIGWSPVSERRAQLIEAAPDLLTAAQRMVAQLGCGNDFAKWEAAKADLLAAIAKATGKETNA